MRGRRKLGRGVAMVGAGMSRFGMFSDKDSKYLFAEAFREMLSTVDKGIDPNDIDALYLGNFTNDFFVRQGHWGPIISDLLGLTPKPATRTEGACASSALAFREGRFAIYAVSREHLMNVTIKSHNNARLNPKAQFNVSIRDIMNQRVEKAKSKGAAIPIWRNEKEFLRDPQANPVVAWPMHLYDCCPISDGASCVLLVAEEIAKSFTDEPLYVAGIGQGSGKGLHAKEDLTYFEATRYAAKEAYELSGLKAEDIQIAEVHDCFSIAEILHIEDLGFFRPGEGYREVEEGLTRLDGSKPINTSGGLKCKGHPVGATGTGQLVEIWKQLRSEAGERQVPIKDLRVGATQSLGGTGGTCTLTILERR